MADSAPTVTYAFVKIIVRDMDRAVDFYERALGLKVTRTIEQETLTEKLLATPGAEAGPFVVLYRHKNDPKLTIGNGWGPIGFFVSDVNAVRQRALASGGKPSRGEPYVTEGVRVGFFLDPEDHEVELVGPAG